jgi:hypothetical protein
VGQTALTGKQATSMMALPSQQVNDTQNLKKKKCNPTYKIPCKSYNREMYLGEIG